MQWTLRLAQLRPRSSNDKWVDNTDILESLVGDSDNSYDRLWSFYNK